MKKSLRKLLVLLSLAGIVLSAVSLYNHYETSTTSYCDLGATFNCDIVNRSSYSVLGGVPVAGIGIAGYLALLLLSLLRDNVLTRKLRLLFSTFGLGFALYLTYIEEHVLRTWCILCLGSLAAILGIVVLSVISSLFFNKTPVEPSGILRR